MRKTLRNSMLFLILSSAIGGCASKPTAVPFDAKWTFTEDYPGHVMSCIDEKDAGKLRELLIRCESRGAK